MWTTHFGDGSPASAVCRKSHLPIAYFVSHARLAVYGQVEKSCRWPLELPKRPDITCMGACTHSRLSDNRYLFHGIVFSIVTFECATVRGIWARTACGPLEGRASMIGS